MRFLAALEIIETDLWQQYNELGGIQDKEVPGGSGSPPCLRPRCPISTAIWRSTSAITPTMRFSHAAFLNAYLKSKGADPVDLSPFRTLPGSTATGAQKNQAPDQSDAADRRHRRLVGPVTAAARKNPDFGDQFAPAIPALSQGKFAAIPRSDADLTPSAHIQAIANTAGFHMPTIEQGGTSLYPALAQRVTSVEVLRTSCSASGPPKPCISRPGTIRQATSCR